MSFPFVRPGDFVSAPVMMGPDPAWIADLERRKETITRLCTALQEFLCFDIEAHGSAATGARRMSNPTPTPSPAAPTLPDTEPRARIQPLGEQIIIRTIPQNSVGSILIPDSAKGITMMGEKGAMDAVHAVEAEVIAVGPGKRQKGDMKLVEDFVTLVTEANENVNARMRGDGSDRRRWCQIEDDITRLILRAGSRNARIPPLVKPGDHILYHPAVQKFDRDITHVMENGNEISGSKYFMIREDSVLAVIDHEG
jgi:co-chaperonin GroES (HSP10)